MSDEFKGLIPDGAIILNCLRVVEFMTADGSIFKQDFSYGGTGEDLDPGKASELVGFANAVALMPYLAEMIHDFVYGDEGDEDEEAEL